jgi:CheY-like chemotaxis protein
MEPGATSQIDSSHDLAPPPVRGGSEAVIVVGDEDAAQALASLGYQVRRVADGAAAIAMLAGGMHADLLLARSEASGHALAECARQALPTMALVLTGGVTADQPSDLEPGVELLAHPWTREELALRVRHALGNQQQVNALTKVLRQAQPLPSLLWRGRVLSAPAPIAHWHVLLVEDQADVRDTSRELLELLGCEVEAVADAETAETALQHERFDVMLTDITLPGRSGLELARTAAITQPALRIVVASGHDRAASTIAGVRTWTLPKPYGAPELEALLGELARI